MDITKTSGEIHALLFKAKELVEELQGNIDSIQEDYGVDGNDDGPIGEATGEALEIVNTLINVDEDGGTLEDAVQEIVDAITADQKAFNDLLYRSISLQ